MWWIIIAYVFIGIVNYFLLRYVSMWPSLFYEGVERLKKPRLYTMATRISCILRAFCPVYNVIIFVGLSCGICILHFSEKWQPWFNKKVNW